jgi:hypothetical protein
MKISTVKWSYLAAATALAVSATGCSELEGDVGGAEEAAVSTNGLTAVNGLSVQNGLPAVNGLSVQNGLMTQNGLSASNGLMTTAAGRNQVRYLVRCALPAGRTLVKQDQNGVNYTFPGLFGLGAGWEAGACDTACQEYVSACLMAHVNTQGQNVPIWAVAQHAGVGWGQDPDFVNLEGTYFGNVFVMGAHGTDPAKTPQLYCNGPQWNVSPPAGRMGSSSPPPFVNPFGTNVACAQRCTPADYPNTTDGYKACNGWNYTLSVWRRSAGAIVPSATTDSGTIAISYNTTSGKASKIVARLKTILTGGRGIRSMDNSW